MVCREFVRLCRRVRLFEHGSVATEGSKFKAVNNRDMNFTERKLQARMQQLEASIAHRLAELDRADREPSDVLPGRVEYLKAEIAKVRTQARQLRAIGEQMRSTEDRQISLTDPGARSMGTSGRGTGNLAFAQCRSSSRARLRSHTAWAIGRHPLRLRYA